jgi:hypothetical protein
MAEGKLSSGKIPVIREKLDEEQVTRELRDIRLDMGRIIDSLFVQPIVEADPDQINGQAVYVISVFDPTLIADLIEFNIMDSPVGFQGWKSVGWNISAGVAGSDQTLLREIRATLQEKHNTTIKVRVRYTDLQGNEHFVGVTHTFDPDDIARVTVDSVAVSGTSVFITFSGDEDTDSIWRKVKGTPDGSATKMFDGRVGEYVFDAAEGQPREWEVAGKNGKGEFGLFILLDLDKLFVLNKSIAVPWSAFIPGNDTTLFFRNLIGGQLQTKIGDTILQALVAPVTLPLGVEIVELSAVMAAPAGGQVLLSFKQGISFLAQLSTTGSVSLSHTVGLFDYYLVLQMQGTPSAVATFDTCRIVYDSPSQESVI